MMTFDQFIKSGEVKPTGTQVKAETKLNQSVIHNLSRTVPATLDNPTSGDIATALSHQITDLNRLIVTDPSCAPVVKRLSEMILRLHFLMLVANMRSHGDGGGSANA